MSGRYPEIVYTEEGMREGMQIEDANIPIDAKVALLDALSETGLKRITRPLWKRWSRLPISSVVPRCMREGSTPERSPSPAPTANASSRVSR